MCDEDQLDFDVEPGVVPSKRSVPIGAHPWAPTVLDSWGDNRERELVQLAEESMGIMLTLEQRRLAIAILRDEPTHLSCGRGSGKTTIQRVVNAARRIDD